MNNYNRHHYVPQWYQYRFLPATAKEKKFNYLDLCPETRVSNGRQFRRRALLKWGPPRCFYQEHLYTTRLGHLTSTEIEEKFFGHIDSRGKTAVEYFASFEHPSVDHKAVHDLLLYLSIQKLRTPKGLANLAGLVGNSDSNQLLFLMQRLQQMHCAIWTESVWAILDAAASPTKFLISDHPVTVYNRGCFPKSRWCRGDNDPPIWLTGTHSIFPLSLDKLLILTNLSWVRNPYANPTKERPNSELFRPAMFKFTDIQTRRSLTEDEVQRINFIMKSRARRYVAAYEEEWLYPERHISTTRWDKVAEPYLLMPDPRSVSFSSEIIIGYEGGRADAFDEYGYKPGQDGYTDQSRSAAEWNTFHAFKGEYARIFGPRRRGLTFSFHRLDDEVDSSDFHEYHLELERKYQKRGRRQR